MFATLSGIEMLARLMQSEKACSPMLITPSGIEMLAKLVHLEKAYLSMTVTLSGITTSDSQMQL